MPETNTISDILNRLMFEQKIRTTELARRTGLPQPTVHRIVTGTSPSPHHTSLKPIAKYFHISVNQLLGHEPIPQLTETEATQQPVVHSIPTITWKEAENWNTLKTDKKLFADRNRVYTTKSMSNDAFALIMNDDAMFPLFPEGSTLVFDPNIPPKKNYYVLVKLKHENHLIFRQLAADKKKQFIRPLNPDVEQYNIIFLDKQDRIFGVLAESRREYVLPKHGL